MLNFTLLSVLFNTGGMGGCYIIFSASWIFYDDNEM